MVTWLVPICLFCTLTALYLGGFKLDIQEASGMRHMGGLLVTFGLYMVAWWALHMVLGGIVGPIAAIVVASLVTIVLLPIVSRAGFRVFGVRITAAH